MHLKKIYTLMKEAMEIVPWLQIDIFIWVHDLFYQHFRTCVIILHSVQYYKTANAPSLLLFFLALLVQNF